MDDYSTNRCFRQASDILAAMSQKRGMAGQVGHAKKAKNEDDEDTPTFEDHLAGLDDEDWGDDAPMEGEHRQALEAAA